MTDKSGNSYLDDVTAPGVVEEKQRRAAALVGQLDAEEKAILGYLVAGWSGREIALALALDLGAFAIRKDAMLAKLRSRSTIEAVRIGIYANIDA